MLVTTTDAIDGWQIQRVCGEVIGVVVLTGVAGGGEAAIVHAEDARADAVSRMLDQARMKGANAVSGLRFDSVVSGAGTSEVCAYGTAVVAIPMTEGARRTANELGYGPPQ